MDTVIPFIIVFFAGFIGRDLLGHVVGFYKAQEEYEKELKEK